MSKKFKINRIPFIFFLGLLILAIFYALYVEISFAGENSEYFGRPRKGLVAQGPDRTLIGVTPPGTVLLP